MHTFPTPEPITATIDVALGDVHITAADVTSTDIEVRPSDPSDEQDVRAAKLTRVEYANRKLLVKAPRLGPPLGRGNDPSIEVSVTLPAGSSLDGRGESADFRAEGPLADCRIKLGIGHVSVEHAGTVNIKSGTGDVVVEHASGQAEITMASGDVRVAALGAGAVIKNSNGDTWVGSAAGDLRIQAANGSITVGVAEATVAAKSANGDVRLGEVARGAAVLETRTGDLEIGIREGTAAWLDVRASAGKVHTALEAADGPGPEGGDTVEVRARTSVGDVVVRRA